MVFLLLGIAFWWTEAWVDTSIRKNPIKVGILHSLSGTMAISEIPVADATRMAIEEINQNGGVLGRRLEIITLDGKSDWPTFAKEAEDLIAVKHVDVIFGCWTSACRKSVKPVIEKYDSLFVYPLQYEGLEQSPNILYVGSAPNQQIIPAVKWSFDNLGRRFFLVGSDYIFPHTANAIITDQVKALNGEIVGEEYIPLGSSNVASIIEKIKESKPDVILNTINGDTNSFFFRELYRDGITADAIPTLSFSISENEIPDIGIENLVGNYAAWNYFQSIDSQENHAFVTAFRKRYGSGRLTSDAMEAAYFGVYLWAQAVESAGSSAPRAVLNALKTQSFNAPEGVVSVDSQTMHTWKIVRIGKINSEGQFDIVWDSQYPIRPVPYPPSRSIEEWNKFLQKFYELWGNQWSNQTTGNKTDDLPEF